MKILFIGDIYGKLGRETIKKILPKIKKEHKPDLIIANAENSAHGSGITETTQSELKESGIHFITMGDHAFDRPEQANVCFADSQPIIRPANLPDQLPGHGHKIFKTKLGDVLIINLLGRVNMPFQYDCPFKKFDEIYKSYDHEKIATTIVDFHGETTAEKICFGHYVDGRAHIVVGTHTHVPTADARLLPKKTAYITDIGMTGAYNESIGIDLSLAIKTLIDQVKYKRTIPDSGEVILSGALINFDTTRKKAKSITQIQYFDKI
ncbi:MAG: TIGR00282 family metallophosphoesterase [bacterium]